MAGTRHVARLRIMCQTEGLPEMALLVIGPVLRSEWEQALASSSFPELLPSIARCVG